MEVCMYGSMVWKYVCMKHQNRWTRYCYGGWGHQQVRFLADLVNSKVVVAGSLLSLFEAFITVTFEPGENSPQVGG